MLKYTFITSVLLFLFGCTTPEKRVPINSLLLGDWISDKGDEDWAGEKLCLTFRDSTYHIFRYKLLYSVSSDTLILTPPKWHKNRDSLPERYFFKITHITEDSLSLSNITDGVFELFSKEWLDSSATIKFHKPQPQNSVQFEHIAFYSSDCYGPCPMMFLEIDSSGNMLFNGYDHTELTGLYSGTLPPSELNYLRQNIRNLKLQELDTAYSADWTDSQICGFYLQTSSGLFKTRVYGVDQEPTAVRILFQTLMSSYKKAELQSDSLIIDKLKFPKIKRFGIPPPPPPPAPSVTKCYLL